MEDTLSYEDYKTFAVGGGVENENNAGLGDMLSNNYVTEDR